MPQVAKSVLVMFIGSLVTAACVKAPDVPKVATPDFGEKPMTEFSAVPTGKFEPTSAPTQVKPLEDVAQCLKTRKDEENDLTKIYKVGQRFVSKMTTLDTERSKASSFIVTKTVTNVSAEFLRVHSALVVGSQTIESEETCSKLKSTPGAHTFFLNCSASSDDSRKYPSCKLESDKTTERYTEGKFTLASGAQVNAIKHESKVEGSLKCSVGNGPITDKGRVVKTEIEITSAAVLTIETAPCIATSVFSYSTTAGADGTITEGFSIEYFEALTP